MGLTREVVAKIVHDLVGHETQTLHGFEWIRYGGHGQGGWRLQSGGGIAGDSRVWWIVRRNGLEHESVGPLTTRKALRRALLEHLAQGENCVPGLPSGYEQFPRRQPNGSVIWIQRRARRQSMGCV